MTYTIILPNYVSDEIHRRLDEELALVPEAECNRPYFREQLIAHFAETGQVADFSIRKQECNS